LERVSREAEEDEEIVRKQLSKCTTRDKERKREGEGEKKVVV
jgi:hypothetical protein